jgi:hypothetical protein
VLADALAALEGSALAATLRGSTWLYPFVNAGHIVGIALLFGAIAPLDLRLIGAWSRISLDVFFRILVPVAVAGLGLAACAGGLLFISKATAYAASALFQTKMLMLALGIANALAYRLLRRRRGRAGSGRVELESIPLQRLMGALSIATWLSVIVLGRLVGYFR